MQSNDSYFKELLAKLEGITGSQNEMRVDIAEIRKDISYHIKRTDLAEESIRLVKEDIKPIKRHVAMLEGGPKLLGVIGLLVAIVSGVLKIFSII